MGNAALSEQSKRRIVDDQVGRMLARSSAFNALPGSLRSEVLANTAAVVHAIAESPTPVSSDPYALPLASALAEPSPLPPGFVTPPGPPQQPESGGFKAEGIREGVGQISRIVREVGFPSFVASLIQGTFHAIVSSSIEQMRAYAELVKSVAQSLNEFRDQNVSENQAKDNLVSRYPNVFQLNIVEGSPRVQPRDNFDTSGDLPNFKKDLGLSDDITDLDEETINDKLIPAARDDLARSRQQLLSTMVLMGINRIIVTDGKINAKVQFQFSAKDQAQTKAVHYDYYNFGQITATSVNASGLDSGLGSDDSDEFGGSNYARGGQSVSMPDVKVTSQTNTDSTASLQASGALFGEVSINFRSETFPLERMADTNQITRLQQAQAGGRGAPAPTEAAAPVPTAGAAPAAAAPAKA
jgi:hypothetical protein